MPDSDAASPARPGWDVRPMLFGAGHLAIIALFIHGMSWLTVHPSVYAVVHGRQLGPSEGFQLASALAAFRVAAPPRVLIIGASTADEGFDEDAITRAVPPYTVINAATGGGTLFCHEILLRAVERQDARPDILVLSLSAMEMFDQSLLLADTGYTDLFDLRDADLAAMDGPEEISSRDRKQLLINTLFPAARHRRVVAMHWRWMLHDLQAACRSIPLDLNRFRRTAYDLQGPRLFRASRVVPDLAQRAKVRDRWQKGNRLDPNFVGQPQHFAQLERILTAATRQAKFVVVVLIPHDSWVREHVDSLAHQRLLDHLQGWRGRCTILDWSTLLDDDEFWDDVHPTVQGRSKVSAAMISFLRNQHQP